MRICLVTGEYPPDEGGVADYTRCLAEALAARGLAVDVHTRKRAGSSETRRRRRGNGTQESAAPTRRSAAEARITVFRVAGVWRWSVASALRSLTALTQPDVLHIQYQTAAYGMHPGINLAPWWLRRTEAVKLAVTYHDVRVPYLFPKAGRLRRWVTLLPARWAHLTVATNAADYAAIAAEGRPWRLELVPIGSNIPDAPPPDYDRAAWREAVGIGPGMSLVAYFGMLNASKGARDLVGALAALRRAGRDLRLVMVGATVGASDPTNIAYRATVKADMADVGLSEAVIWTGHLPSAEVSAWLRAADVIALPYADGASYRRGSLLAALAHGRPVVTTAPPPPDGTTSLEDPLPPLVDGISARLVPPGDPAALAEGLAQVLDDPALATRLSEGARGVATHFGWEAIAERHEALYRELVGSTPY